MAVLDWRCFPTAALPAYLCGPAQVADPVGRAAVAKYNEHLLSAVKRGSEADDAASLIGLLMENLAQFSIGRMLAIQAIAAPRPYAERIFDLEGLKIEREGFLAALSHAGSYVEGLRRRSGDEELLAALKATRMAHTSLARFADDVAKGGSVRIEHERLTSLENCGSLIDFLLCVLNVKLDQGAGSASAATTQRGNVLVVLVRMLRHFALDYSVAARRLGQAGAEVESEEATDRADAREAESEDAFWSQVGLAALARQIF